MGLQVCSTAMLSCSFGTVPTPLVVLPVNRVLTSGMPAATIMDHVPFLNIMPFGICNAPTNPAVVAAKAIGAPCPCTPVTAMPWAPGAPTVTVGGIPALNNESVLMCTWLGVITVEEPGQVTEMIP